MLLEEPTKKETHVALVDADLDAALAISRVDLSSHQRFHILTRQPSICSMHSLLPCCPRPSQQMTKVFESVVGDCCVNASVRVCVSSAKARAAEHEKV